MGGAEGAEGLHRPPGLVPEREVGPHDHVLSVQALRQPPADELLCRDEGEGSVESEDEEDVHTGRLDEPSLAVRRGQELRFPPRGQGLPGMPVERDDDGSQSALPGGLDSSAEDGLMAYVHAVEEPDRHDRRAGAEGKRLQSVPQLHARQPIELSSSAPERTAFE